MSMNRHGPEQIVKKLRDGEAMPSAGKDLTAVLVAFDGWRGGMGLWWNRYGGIKSEETKWLTEFEDENRLLEQNVAHQGGREDFKSRGFGF